MAGANLPRDLAPAPLPQPPLPTTPRRGISDAGLAVIVGGIALLAVVLAVAAINGGDIGGNDDSTTGTGVPTFTLPAADSLTLTVTGDTLPLPGVVTDTGVVDTGMTDTFEVFTDTTASVPPVTDTAPITTISGDTGVSTPEMTLEIG
jgi:hypothetical protein